MWILTRYLFRLHAGPFLFAAATLTAIMLLDQVAKKLNRLLGKDLGWQIIVEVFVYSIPFILAVILPMAVLVAVLYAFNRLAAENEITAMRASGVSLTRLVLPLLGAASLLAAGMVWFNDTVLPESNHRLQVLLTSIGRKKPTFVLRERTINEVLPASLFLQAGRIDRATSELKDVTIFDEREAGISRTFYADSGRMAYDEAGTELFLQLYDGIQHEWKSASPDEFQVIHFRQLTMRVPEVSNELERGELSGFRGDREMPIAQMREEARLNQDEAEAVSGESRALAVGLTRKYLGSLAPASEGDSAAQRASDRAGLVEKPAAAVAQFRAQATSRKMHHQRSNKFEVEIQKKYTIPAACIVFVLIGAPIGTRYRRAGVGLVVGVSFVVFCAYYVAIIGGEDLADRAILSPFWAMWAPNILFGALGAALLWRARRAGG
ncbi:MAG: LptF/LptG family permease [Gemmatimonadota bacterium]